MKMSRSKFFRGSTMLIGASLVLAGLSGCGKDASDPEAVTLDQLKAPGNLWIQDNGNGAVMLYWTGSNNEKDFDGYNVYGLNKSKITFGDYGEGKAVELLDEKGEPVQAAKDFLGQFNYNPDKPFEEAATVTDGGETKFSALPVYQKNGEDKILPTCGVESGVCKDHSTTFTRQSVSDNSARGTNGSVSYSVSGLTVGQTYCFFVLSSMEEGAKVSMTSTNISCVTPRYKSEFSMTIPTGQSDKLELDMHTFLATCMASGCATGDSTAVKTSTLGAAAKATDAGPMYVEHYLDGAFTPGKNVGVRDMGFYETGFADMSLPQSAPALVLDTNVDSGSGPIINGGGYTPAGRSRKIEKNHVYVFAVPAKDDTSTTPSKFYYHWMWVKGAVTPGSATNVEMRISAVIDQR